MDTQNNNAIDVEYTDLSNQVFLTAPQIAKELNVNPAKIRYWADTYGDIEVCGVKWIDDRKKYEPKSIKAFKLIQKLVEEKNYSKPQVRDYLTNYGVSFPNGENALVNPENPISFEAIESILSLEMEENLQEFIEYMTTQLEESNKKMIENLEEKISLKVDEVVSDTIDKHLSEIKKEFEKTAELNEKLDNMKILMDERKKEYEEEKNKSWFKKIFKK